MDVVSESLLFAQAELIQPCTVSSNSGKTRLMTPNGGPKAA